MDENNNEDDSYDDLEERRPTKRTNWRRRTYSITEREKKESVECLYDVMQFNNLLNVLFHLRCLIDSLVLQQLHRTPNYWNNTKQVCNQVIWFIYLLITNQLSEYYHKIYTIKRLLMPFPPPKNRKIDNITDEWAPHNTRFTKTELKKLYIHLRIPAYF